MLFLLSHISVATQPLQPSYNKRNTTYNSLPVSATVTSNLSYSFLHFLSMSYFLLKTEFCITPIGFLVSILEKIWEPWVCFVLMTCGFFFFFFAFFLLKAFTMHMWLIYLPSGAKAIHHWLSSSTESQFYWLETRKQQTTIPSIGTLIDRLIVQFKDLGNREGRSRAVTDMEQIKWSK